jgi:prophage antirepressor-like protein
MSMNLFEYAGQQVRTIVTDGEPWFVIADVAKVLDLSNPSMVAHSIDSDDLSTAEVIDGVGRTQASRVVNESGLFAIVFQSRKPEARAFKRWVTHEVLPAIRRTGSYSVAEKSPMEIIADQHKAVAYLLEANEKQAVAITALTPRAEAWDDLASAAGDYSVGDAAKILARAGIATGQQRLFYQLADIGWIKRRGETWFVMQTAVDPGYLAEKPQSHHHPRTGAVVLDPPQVRVTIRGLERLRVRLGTLTSTAPALTAVNA